MFCPDFSRSLAEIFTSILHSASASSNEQAIIRRSLACTKDPVMVQVYLQLSTQDDIRLQGKDTVFNYQKLEINS